MVLVFVVYVATIQRKTHHMACWKILHSDDFPSISSSLFKIRQKKKSHGFSHPFPDLPLKNLHFSPILAPGASGFRPPDMEPTGSLAALQPMTLDHR